MPRPNRLPISRAVRGRPRPGRLHRSPRHRQRPPPDGKPAVDPGRMTYTSRRSTAYAAPRCARGTGRGPTPRIDRLRPYSEQARQSAAAISPTRLSEGPPPPPRTAPPARYDYYANMHSGQHPNANVPQTRRHCTPAAAVLSRKREASDLRHTIVPTDKDPAGGWARPGAWDTARGAGPILDGGPPSPAVHSVEFAMPSPRPGAGTRSGAATPGDSSAGLVTEVCLVGSSCYDGPAPDLFAMGTMPRLAMEPMKRNSEIQKIAFVGDYLPRKCGIATFTHDLCTSVATQYPGSDCFVVPINDIAQGYDYPGGGPVRDRGAGARLVPAGGRLPQLRQHRRRQPPARVRHLRRPGRQPRRPADARPADADRHDAAHRPPRPERRPAPGARQVTELSARLVVMSERARGFLREIYDVPEGKIDLIAHGIPDMPFVDPNFYKDQFGVEGKHVVLTFGLLSPNKGIEMMLRAMPAILREFPDFVYIVLGATAPEPPARAGRALPDQPGAAGQGAGHQAERHLLQPVRGARRAERVHRGGGHLHHALPEPGADRLRHAGLFVRLRQGGDLDSLLACRGAAGRRPRGARAVRRLLGAGARGGRAPARRAATTCDAQDGTTCWAGR